MCELTSRTGCPTMSHGCFFVVVAAGPFNVSFFGACFALYVEKQKMNACTNSGV